MSQQQTDAHRIVIIGGGMVGLSLSLMLAKLPIEIVLIETTRYQTVDELRSTLGEHVPQYTSAQFDVRNTALSRRTVDIYQQLNLWPLLVDYATPIHEIRISEVNGFGKARLLASEEHVDNFGQVIENRRLGQLLLYQAYQHDNITLIDQARVVRLEQDSTGVDVTIEHSSISALRAPLVVAADGRDSVCRQQLGIGSDEKDYGQTAIVATLKTSLPHNHIAFERFGVQGPIALLPLPDGAYSCKRSLVWSMSHEEAAHWLAVSDTQFLQQLQRVFGYRAGEFLQIGARNSFVLSQMIAHQQAAGRVVLMGNAAHTLHPVAGQGFNLCMRDADVLVAMIGQQLNDHQDIGDPTLLKAYEARRLVDQRRVIRFCDWVVNGFGEAYGAWRWLRNVGLTLFDHTPGVKGLLARYAMGLSV